MKQIDENVASCLKTETASVAAERVNYGSKCVSSENIVDGEIIDK